MKIKPWVRPTHYFGSSWNGWYVGLARTRDSGPLEQSNFQTVLAQLKTLPEVEVDNNINGDTEPVPGVQVVRERHFLCGWIEWVAIHESNTKALELADQLMTQLESYTILDEEDYSRLEYNQKCDYWDFMSMQDRIDVCAESGISIFAARCKTPPSQVFDHLN